MNEANQVATHCQTLLNQALETLDARLAGFLEDIGEPEAVDELRAGLLRRWEREGTTPEEQFLELNLRRVQDQFDIADMVEMAFAAREEAVRSLHAPAQALQWLMSVENCLGYAEALSSISLRSEQKRQAAKKSEASITADALKDDVLAFIRQHQPPEGWDRQQLVKHFVAQPIETISSIAQSQKGFDNYWADIKRKLNRWLSEPEFSKKVDALLKGQSSVATSRRR